MKFHFLRDLTKDMTLDFVNCQSEDQVADLFTKPLKCPMFLKLHELIGVFQMEKNQV